MIAFFSQGRKRLRFMVLSAFAMVLAACDPAALGSLAGADGPRIDTSAPVPVALLIPRGGSGADELLAQNLENAAKLAMADLAGAFTKALDAPVTARPEAWDEIFGIFPSRLEAAHFWNWQIVTSLRRSGDDNTKPRPITHAMYDVAKSQRSGLETALREAGYAIESHSDDSIMFSRSGVVDLAEIDNETRALHELAERYECGYDGWKTEIVRKESG